MDSFNIAIFGCGTVGGGVAKIILENETLLAARAGKPLRIVKIVDLFPKNSSERHEIPRELFCGDEDTLTKEQADEHTSTILADSNIDMVIETIGGSSQFMVDLALRILKSGKHLVTANKALLAKNFKLIMQTAVAHKKTVGFEAAVCGAIPIIKGITECFSGDRILKLTGILNGTSNYILSKMNNDNLSFAEALKEAQALGYAEADPTLDVNGGDAGHKLVILTKIIHGLETPIEDMKVLGIDTITEEDTYFAKDIGCVIKLIGFLKYDEQGIYATVRPMMVPHANLLSTINEATNAVKAEGAYSQENVMIGQGAGSLETGSAIVSDIVFIARHGASTLRVYDDAPPTVLPFEELSMRYMIIFPTRDKPGVTGLVATAIGQQLINIDTVSHNLRTPEKEGAVFSVVTSPCTYSSIQRAIDSIRSADSLVLIGEPKVIPILD